MKTLFHSQLILFLLIAWGTCRAQTIESTEGVLRQARIDSLEKGLNELYGKDKLIALNQMTALYLANNKPKAAMRYAKRAEELAENIITVENKLLSQSDYYLKPLTFIWLGQANMQQGYYLEGREAFEKALVDAEKFNNYELAAQARDYLVEIDSISSSSKSRKRLFGDKFRDLGSSITETSSGLSISATLKLAENSEKNGNYPKAIDYYNSTINQLRDIGDWRRVMGLREHVGDLYRLAGMYAESANAYQDILLEKNRIGDSTGVALITAKIGQVSQITDPTEDTDEAVAAVNRPTPPKISPEEEEILKNEAVVKDIRSIAEQAEEDEDFEKSLNYYKQYVDLQGQLADEKRLQELALLEKVHLIENQDREITLLKQNEEITTLQIAQTETTLRQQAIFRRNLIIGLFLLASLVFTLYLMYRNKRRDHNKLGVAYRDLESTQNQLKDAEKRIMSLLHQQVSGAVANELLSTSDERKVERRFVCIMFLDIRDFTPFAEQRKPEEIIEYQNEVFGFMISIIEEHKGIVNQIMGDGFMATFGAPESAGNDCLQAYNAAKKIMEQINQKNEEGTIPPTKVGIGLHAGFVVTGNVGTQERKQYSITGNTVILAARLEQLNKQFGSTLVFSKEVYDELPADVREPVKFSRVNVKGRTQPVEIAAV